MSYHHLVFYKNHQDNGIIYYIDSASNGDDTEDIALNKTNPKVIAKYEKTLDGEYSIPLYNI